MRISPVVSQEPPLLPVPEQDFSERRRDRISARAYEIYEARGGAEGQDIDDWLQAEKLIDDEAGRPDSEG